MPKQQMPELPETCKTLRDLYLAEIKRYNHPDGSSCPYCSGKRNTFKGMNGSVETMGGMMMVLAPGQSEKYYHGLLVPCPACNYYYVSDPKYWWDEAYLDVQEEYRAAFDTHENRIKGGCS